MISQPDFSASAFYVQYHQRGLVTSLLDLHSVKGQALIVSLLDLLKKRRDVAHVLWLVG